jgi:TolB-like protein
MKRNIIAAAMVCALACAVFAQAGAGRGGAADPKKQEKLAILPFTGLDAESGETIAELFSYSSELNEVFAPIPRTSIASAIARERNFQMSSGMTDPETIAALGRQLGAQYVIAGNIAALKNRRLLAVSIIRIEDLQLVAGDVQEYGDIAEIRAKVPGMARAVIASIRIDRRNLPKLAIVPFQFRTATNTKDADVLAQILAIQLAKNGRYAVYPRTQSLEQVQGEYRNQMDGNTADENIARLGQGENPRLVLSGAARRLSDEVNMFNVSLINLETGVQENGLSREYQDISDGLAVIEGIAQDIPLYGGARARREAKRERERERASRDALFKINADESFRSDASPFLFGLFGLFQGLDVDFLVIPAMLGAQYYTSTNGNSGYTLEALKINYSVLPYTSLGIGAGFGVTADENGAVVWNWAGVKAYAGIVFPFGIKYVGRSHEFSFLFFADALLEIGYSDWGGLLNRTDSAGFGVNPGFEAGIALRGFTDGYGFYSYSLEFSYGGIWRPDGRYTHSAGIAWKLHLRNDFMYEFYKE